MGTDFTYILVDDEAHGRQNMRALMEDYGDGFVSVGEADSAQSAIDLIKKVKPDLVFLDVEMPFGNGFTVLEAFPEGGFEVIFTTAYDQYALKAFRFSAIDYLLKPIDPDDLEDGLKRFKRRAGNSKENGSFQHLLHNLGETQPERKRLCIPTEQGFDVLSVKEIIHVEASNGYSVFHLQNQPSKVSTRTLTDFEDLLIPPKFMRVHKSHLINLERVTSFMKGKTGRVVLDNGAEIEISRRKRNEFMEAMAELKTPLPIFAYMAKLILIPTPIGNLEDITLRAIRVLREADLIAAEDTRQTTKLLRHYEISTPMTSLHAHNEHSKSGYLVEKAIQENLTVALVSDAGSPGISDPGFLIVREALEKGLEVETLPGPTAFVPALVNSGIPCDKFVFEGFLPHKKGRQTRIKFLAEETRTLVFYESPHRLLKTLRDFVSYFGSDRQVSVARELTKLHEEHVRGTLESVLAHFENGTVKGEFVIVLAGAK